MTDWTKLIETNIPTSHLPSITAKFALLIRIYSIRNWTNDNYSENYEKRDPKFTDEGTMLIDFLEPTLHKMPRHVDFSILLQKELSNFFAV